MMLKEDTRTDFAFAEILDRARDLNRELVRSGSDTREVSVTVTDNPEVDGGGGGSTAVPKCTVVVVSDTIKEAKGAKSHLEGKDHNCTCTRVGTTVTCSCP
jgi:hypothetical protein